MPKGLNNPLACSAASCQSGRLQSQRTMLHSGLTLMLCLSTLWMRPLSASSSMATPTPHHKYANETAIMGIFTHFKQFEPRLTIRSTYIRQMRIFTNIHFRFVLEVPNKLEEPDENLAIKSEAHLFRDMLLLEYLEPDVEHAGKAHLLLLSFFSWTMKQQKSYDYIIKVDIETYVHPFNLQRLLASLPRQRVYWGNAVKGNYSFNQSSGDVQHFKSSYMSWEGYLLSRDLVAWIVEYKQDCREVASELLKNSTEEDKVVGLWVAVCTKQMELSPEGGGGSKLSGRRRMQEAEEKQEHSAISFPYEATEEEIKKEEEGKEFKAAEVLPLQDKYLLTATQNQWVKYNQSSTTSLSAITAPLSAILVHGLQEAGTLPHMHMHFVANSYGEWHACAHLGYQPALCHTLWKAEDHLGGWPTDFSQFYTELSKVPKQHKKVDSIIQKRKLLLEMKKTPEKAAGVLHSLLG